MIEINPACNAADFITICKKKILGVFFNFNVQNIFEACQNNSDC